MYLGRTLDCAHPKHPRAGGQRPLGWETQYPTFHQKPGLTRLVISYACNTNANVCKLRFKIIQFHELTNAKWSPVNRSIKDKKQAIAATHAF